MKQQTKHCLAKKHTLIGSISAWFSYKMAWEKRATFFPKKRARIGSISVWFSYKMVWEKRTTFSEKTTREWRPLRHGFQTNRYNNRIKREPRNLRVPWPRQRPEPKIAAGLPFTFSAFRGQEENLQHTLRPKPPLLNTLFRNDEINNLGLCRKCLSQTYLPNSK